MKLTALAIALFLLPQQQPPVPKGRMEGTVLRENTQEPVVGARVTVTRVNGAGAAVPTAGTLNTYLINPTPNVAPAPGPNPNAPAPAPGQLPPTQPAPIPTVTTDRSGKWVVPDLAEGTYRVAVTLNGYVRQEYGQRGFTGQGTTLTLGKDETLKDLNIRLTRAGNISGRITDENGQPASGVPVQLIKFTYTATGLRMTTQVGQGRTNDRGEYRLYWITPGRYYLTGGTPAGPPPGSAPGGNPSANESLDPYTFTYYPGTTDVSRARVVEVQAGSDQPMDMVVPRSRLFKISGRIAGVNNAPPPINSAFGNAAVGISLAFLRLEGGSGFIMMSQTYDPITQTYELRNVAAGSYAVQANSGSATGRAIVEVTNADVENLTVTLDAGVNLTGKVQVVGGGALPATPVRIQLKPIFSGVTHFVGAVPAAQVTPADGTFRFNGILPGAYRASASANGYYVKELRFENSEALNADIKIDSSSGTPNVVTPGRPATPNNDTATTGPVNFTVVLSNAVGQIDGVVTDDKNQPLPGIQAVLIPNTNRDRTDLFKNANTDQAGRFKLTDITPGEYKLFAWDGVEGFAYFDPDFLAKYDARGKAVRVDEGGKLSVDTKVIPQ